MVRRAQTVENAHIRFNFYHSRLNIFIFLKVTPEILKEEFDAIDKQQSQINKEANILEKRLHKLLAINGNKNLEETLTKNWLLLINKRNKLLRKEMRLNIL